MVDMVLVLCLIPLISFTGDYLAGLTGSSGFDGELTNVADCFQFFKKMDVLQDGWWRNVEKNNQQKPRE
jgi:hypothetical protein